MLGKILKVLGIVFLTIIGLGVIIYFIPLPEEDVDDSTDTDTEEVEKAEVRTDYTDDQKKFIYNFGRPNSWELTFNQEDEPTLEVWKYIELGEVITFGDGNFIDRVEYGFPVPEGNVIMDAMIEPKDVYKLTTLEELNDLLGTEPTVTADINSEIWEGAKFYSYDEIVTAGTIDDELVFIKTQSYSIDLSDESDAATTTSDTILYENNTYGFSLELPASWYDYEVEEDSYYEDGSIYYTFSLPTDDPEYADFGGKIMIFTIEVYSQLPDEDLLFFSTYAGENENYYFYYSHLNDIPSEEIDPRIWDFTEILDTLRIY